MILFAWFAVALLFINIGLVLSKLWCSTGKFSYVVFSLVAFSLGSAVWFPIVKISPNISTSAVTWDILCVITATLLGVIVYSEAMSIEKFIGIALCLIGIVMVNK